MNRDTVIALARQAGLFLLFEEKRDKFEHFAALVAAHERDSICAVLDTLHQQEERHSYYGFISRMIKEMK